MRRSFARDSHRSGAMGALHSSDSHGRDVSLFRKYSGMFFKALGRRGYFVAEGPKAAFKL